MNQDTVIQLYGRMQKNFFQRLHEYCQNSKLHPGQVPLVICLKKMDGCSQSDLSRTLNVSPASVAISLKRLEKQGIIHKRVNPLKLRENIIALTEKGEKEAEFIKGTINTLVSQALYGIDESEMELLTHTLEKICMNLNSLNNKGIKSKDA